MEAEEFLQKKDIWNHPRISDRNNKESYDVAELLEEYAILELNKFRENVTRESYDWDKGEDYLRSL